MRVRTWGVHTNDASGLAACVYVFYMCLLIFSFGTVADLGRVRDAKWFPPKTRRRQNALVTISQTSPFS